MDMSDAEMAEILDVYSQLGLLTETQRLRFQQQLLVQRAHPIVQTIYMADSTTDVELPEAGNAKLE